MIAVLTDRLHFLSGVERPFVRLLAHLSPVNVFQCFLTDDVGTACLDGSLDQPPYCLACIRQPLLALSLLETLRRRLLLLLPLPLLLRFRLFSDGWPD